MCGNGCCKLPPVFLLVYFTLVHMLIYIDRGVLASIVSTLEDHDRGLGLTPAEIGLLGSFFMFGFMIAGPIFAHYSQSSHSLTLIGIGLLIWGASSFGAGMSRSFLELAIARACSGVGEASFVCLAPPYIMDHAPSARKTTWIAVFYSAISIGFALGNIFGNTVSEALGGWYWPFYIEGVFIVPFVLISFMGKKVSLQSGLEVQVEIIPLCKQFAILAKCLSYDFIVLGFAAYIFTIGGIGYWGTYVIEKLFSKTPRVAAFSLGIIIIISGSLGTLLGSIFFDCSVRKFSSLHSEKKIKDDKFRNITTEKANLFLFITTFFSIIFFMAGLFIDEFFYFVIFFGVGLFTLFL